VSDTASHAAAGTWSQRVEEEAMRRDATVPNKKKRSVPLNTPTNKRKSATMSEALLARRGLGSNPDLENILPISEKSSVAVPMVEMIKDLPWFSVDSRRGYPYDGPPSFKGPLKEPIHQAFSDAPVIDGVSHADGIINSIFIQRVDKLILLLKFYNLEDSNDPWLLLCLRLACNFVPGLRVLSQPLRGPGRPRGPKKWTNSEQSRLLAAVEQVRGEKTPRRSVKKSIEILQKNDPERWSSLNEARYYEARRDDQLRRQVLLAVTSSATTKSTI
jgi:hypothetical protein